MFQEAKKMAGQLFQRWLIRNLWKEMLQTPLWWQDRHARKICVALWLAIRTQFGTVNSRDNWKKELITKEISLLWHILADLRTLKVLISRETERGIKINIICELFLSHGWREFVKYIFHSCSVSSLCEKHGRHNWRLYYPLTNTLSQLP